MEATMSKLYGIPQAASRADMHPNTIYRAIARGDIAVVEINGRNWIAEAEIDRYAAERLAYGPYHTYRQWRAARTAAAV
jgi:hypothetical protein